jgi:prephenate dehydrogenase
LSTAPADPGAAPPRVAVVGVGLIGGSIALAARERLRATVTGFDESPSALEEALARGAIDTAAASTAAAVKDADYVFVAVPVGGLPRVVEEALSAAPSGAVVTDVGSTKRAVVGAHDDPRYIGGHPLAGAETTGIEHARGDLFEHATWYLTPTARTSGVLYERLYRLLHGLGARPTAIDADTHDTMLAAVSHLPHVLANVLVAQAARVLESGDEGLPATGPSFRDATRVAGAASSVWTDIYLSNRDALAAQLEQTIASLQEVRAALSAADPEAITAWNDAAARDRQRLLEAGLGGGPQVELRVSVPNRPGVIAELALELGRAGVNITDMALYPTPDMSEGVVAFWLTGEASAQRAADLVQAKLGFPVARA